MKNPLRAESANIFNVDLRQTAITTAGIVSVVRRPILARGAHQQKRRLNIHQTRNLHIVALPRRGPDDAADDDGCHTDELTRMLHPLPTLPFLHNSSLTERASVNSSQVFQVEGNSYR